MIHPEKASGPDIIPEKISVTGIVVTFNETRHLRECLESLSFCDQRVIVDLGSRDATLRIAKGFGADIVHEKKVPVIEEIRERSLTYAKYDWVVLLDPDEVFPVNIEQDLCFLISREPKLGAISLPLQYYFLGKRLRYTIWGGTKFLIRVVHKRRVEFNSQVHGPISLKEGFLSTQWQSRQDVCIKHFWIDSYGQLLKKHWRYMQKEGEARYLRGQRFSLRRSLNEIFHALKYNLIDCQGLRGGFLGIFLSLFYGWYVSMSIGSLMKHQKMMDKAG